MTEVQYIFKCASLISVSQPDSQIYKDAKRLEEFFDAQLAKLLPDYTHWSGEGSPPAKRARTD